MILPLYFFTLVFVAGPLIYMVALSFAQPGSGTSVEWNLTLENYRKILDPVYLQTFRESFQLALTSTVIICLVGYPFGYFMAKMSDTWKKRAMLLDQFPDPSLRMDHHPSEQGCAELYFKGAGYH